MYPSSPDWNSAAPNSAWVVRAGHVCQTTGWNFLLDLQTQLRFRLADALATYDGTSVQANDLTVNDPTGAATGWNTVLLRALWAVASADRAPSDALAAIQSDAISSNVSARTLATAIWVADFNTGYATGSDVPVYGQGSPNEIVIPAGTSMPTFWNAPPIPASGADQIGLDCHLIGGANVTPIDQTIVPFVVNPWAAVGVLAIGVVAAAFLTQNVPVKKRK